MTPGSGALADTQQLLPDDRQPVIIAARRTPICRANGALKTLHAHELLAPVLRSLLADAGLAPASVAVSATVIVTATVMGAVTAAPATGAAPRWPPGAGRSSP